MNSFRCKIHHITAVQVEYSPFSLDIEDPTINLLATCRELGVAVVAYSPLGRGFLAGKIKSVDDIPEGDARRYLPRFLPENFRKNLRLVDTFNEIAAAKQVPVSALVLSWLMRQGDDIFPIPGSTSARNIAQNLLAVSIQLTDEEVRVIREAVQNAVVVGGRYPDG
jgi:aryl-alcohol dehydrogenase-like predicted oxidoreductase